MIKPVIVTWYDASSYPGWHYEGDYPKNPMRPLIEKMMYQSDDYGYEFEEEKET